MLSAGLNEPPPQQAPAAETAVHASAATPAGRASKLYGGNDASLAGEFDPPLHSTPQTAPRSRTLWEMHQTSQGLRHTPRTPSTASVTPLGVQPLSFHRSPAKGNPHGGAGVQPRVQHEVVPQRYLPAGGFLPAPERSPQFPRTSPLQNTFQSSEPTSTVRWLTVYILWVPFNQAHPINLIRPTDQVYTLINGNISLQQRVASFDRSTNIDSPSLQTQIMCDCVFPFLNLTCLYEQPSTAKRSM